MKAEIKSPPEEYLGNNLLAVCNLVETKIGHELNLINHRVSWLATSQSFLVLALVTLIPGYLDKRNIIVGAFLLGIPVTGLVVCAQVTLAVRAAFKVLRDHLLRERENLTSELNRAAGTGFASLGPDRMTDFFGALPARWIPVTFIVMWLFALTGVGWLLTHA